VSPHPLDQRADVAAAAGVGGSTRDQRRSCSGTSGRERADDEHVAPVHTLAGAEAVLLLIGQAVVVSTAVGRGPRLLAL